MGLVCHQREWVFSGLFHTGMDSHSISGMSVMCVCLCVHVYFNCVCVLVCVCMHILIVWCVCVCVCVCVLGTRWIGCLHGDEVC